MTGSVGQVTLAGSRHPIPSRLRAVLGTVAYQCAVVAAVAGCAVSAAGPATSAAASPVVSASVPAGALSSSTATAPAAPAPSLIALAPVYSGLPTRFRVTVPPPNAGAAVVVSQRVGTRWVPLVSSVTDAAGRSTVSWRWSTPGVRLVKVTATSPGRVLASLPTRVAALKAAPAVTPPTSAAAVTGVRSAGGQRQWIDCQGTGGPTMVLVAGLTGWSKDWIPVVNQLRAGGRVCVYDRPGLGKSPARTGTLAIDSATHARELFALLTAAGEKGPFVLVGHSYGGLIVRSMLALHPEQVSGLAALEAVPPGMNAISGYAATFSEAGATINLASSSASTGFAGPLAGLPLFVLSIEHPEAGRPASVVDAWRSLQVSTARASNNSLRVIALNTGHQVQAEAPLVVVEGLNLLRTSVRAHRPLPACGSIWGTLNAVCEPR